MKETSISELIKRKRERELSINGLEVIVINGGVDVALTAEEVKCRLYVLPRHLGLELPLQLLPVDALLPWTGRYHLVHHVVLRVAEGARRGASVV